MRVYPTKRQLLRSDGTGTFFAHESEMKSMNCFNTRAGFMHLLSFALLFSCARLQAAIFTVDTTSDVASSACTAALISSTTALTSCVLANSGAPGAITINAVYDTFTDAFGNLVTGGNVNQSANFFIASN